MNLMYLNNDVIGIKTVFIIHLNGYPTDNCYYSRTGIKANWIIEIKADSKIILMSF